jgi:hypothetical protein
MSTTIEDHSQALADAIYRHRVLRVRELPPEVKFRAGADLFDQVCERMRAGLRDKNPKLMPQ